MKCIDFSISGYITLSSFIKGTISRNDFTTRSISADDLNGLLNSRACTEVKSSMAIIFSRFSATRNNFVAPLAPMLT